MTTDDSQPRRTPRVRDPKASAERRAAEAREEHSHPAYRAARAADTLGGITATMGRCDNASELYGVLVQLTHLTDHAGKILDQANQWLRTQHRAGQVVATADGGDVDATIQALLAAAVAGRAFSTAIDDAAWHAGHLTEGEESTG